MVLLWITVVCQGASWHFYLYKRAHNSRQWSQKQVKTVLSLVIFRTLKQVKLGQECRLQGKFMGLNLPLQCSWLLSKWRLLSFFFSHSLRPFALCLSQFDLEGKMLHATFDIDVCRFKLSHMSIMKFRP